MEKEQKPSIQLKLSAMNQKKKKCQYNHSKKGPNIAEGKYIFILFGVNFFISSSYLYIV